MSGICKFGTRAKNKPVLEGLPLEVFFFACSSYGSYSFFMEFSHEIGLKSVKLLTYYCLYKWCSYINVHISGVIEEMKIYGKKELLS